MIEMLHNEARKLLVEGYEATHNAEAIAKISTSTSTPFTIWKSGSGKQAALTCKRGGEVGKLC